MINKSKKKRRRKKRRKRVKTINLKRYKLRRRKRRNWKKKWRNKSSKRLKKKRRYRLNKKTSQMINQILINPQKRKKRSHPSQSLATSTLLNPSGKTLAKTQIKNPP
jgi:hypothetical protein